MKISVNTFSRGTVYDSVAKVREESFELEEAYFEYKNALIQDAYEKRKCLMLEIGDVLTATMNLCKKIGFDAQECVDMVETKNILRGYYDTIE